MNCLVMQHLIKEVLMIYVPPGYKAFYQGKMRKAYGEEKVESARSQ